MEKFISNAPRLSLSAKIFFGMGAGIFAGILFGASAQQFYVIGQVFIQLLQMSILPFLMLSLLTGLGNLTYEVKRPSLLGKRRGASY